MVNNNRNNLYFSRFQWVMGEVKPLSLPKELSIKRTRGCKKSKIFTLRTKVCRQKKLSTLLLIWLGRRGNPSQGQQGTQNPSPIATCPHPSSYTRTPTTSNNKIGATCFLGPRQWICLSPSLPMAIHPFLLSNRTSRTDLSPGLMPIIVLLPCNLTTTIQMGSFKTRSSVSKYRSRRVK